MVTHVALLRGINVGGRNKVAMADLRAAVASLGHADVSTYIQSGNVLFTAAPGSDRIAADLERAIADKTGVTTPVVLLSLGELEQAAAGNPYREEPDPKRVHAVVLAGEPGQDLVARITAAGDTVRAAGSKDSVRIAGRVIFLHTPDGYGRSDLSVLLFRILDSRENGMTATARNWSTVTKLLALGGR
jgi:uncharacterized protein (DUF1697 family)